MIQTFVKRLRRMLYTGVTLKIFGIAAVGAFSAVFPPLAFSLPTIGAVTSSAPAGGVPLYGKLDLAFAVSTSATSPFLPYDFVAPAYVANLHPTEDARNGVSVDALLLPPGQTDWNKAQVWPCYWQEDFDGSLTPTGNSGWHLHFAPTQVGTWSYEIRATDASGVATTSPATFNCAPSTSKGFVRVSPTDTRYFQYSDGTPFIASGDNVGGAEAYQAMSSLYAAGATALLRVWLGTDGGMGLIGGFNENTQAQGFSGYGAAPYAGDAHSGRYSFQISGSAYPQIAMQTQPNTVYTISFWAKGSTPDPGLNLTWTNLNNFRLTTAWQHFTAVWNTANGPIPSRIGITGAASASEYALVDDLTIDNPAGGDVLGGAGSFEWHTSYNQYNAAQLDEMMATAATEGQYLKLVCVNKFDQSFGSINPDGTANGGTDSPELALGGSGDPNADTAVLRLQKYYARYMMARWGYSTALQSLEYTNEMDYAHTLQYAGAQSFGAAVHAYSAEGRMPVTSSTALNGSGITYDTSFYESPNYPDIDYADFHFYPSSYPGQGPFLPYDDVPYSYNCRGDVRVPSGGPNGLGYLKFQQNLASASDPNYFHAFFVLPTLQAKGTWTIKFFYKTSPDAVLGYNPNIQIHQSALPGGYVMVSAPQAVNTVWTEYSGTFSLADGNPHSGALLDIVPGLGASPASSYTAYSDVRLIAPDGRTFYRLTFNEPTFDKDSASVIQYLPGGKQSYSGDPAVNKPFMLGETSVPSQGADTTAQVFARQACWGGALSPGGMIPIYWHDVGGDITEYNGWRYQGGVERFLQGVPLSNGLYRDLEAVASPTLRVIGQKDVQDGEAVVWVQNAGSAGDGSDAANWYNLTFNPALCAPVSGTVTIPGLPDGVYQADVWDTNAGKSLNSPLTLTSSGGVLTVPVNGLAVDEAVKITPAASPHLALSLTSDKTSVSPGDKVTFTLTYTNQGTLPALGVHFPWTVPDHTQFVSAAGGTYDASQNTVTWLIGTVPPGGTGSISLTVLVQ